MERSSASRKNIYAFISIALSAAGLIVDFILRRPIADTLSLGFVLSFAAFLLSLASVKESGRNLLAMTAFWMGFICMWVTLMLCLL